jgi:hypothetical protein
MFPSYPAPPPIVCWSITAAASLRNCDGAGIDASNNSWDISGLSVSNADFLSVDTVGVFGPRKADDSLPDVKFMHLSSTSRLIDKGTDIGFPFTGTAPDLGAFEYGAVTRTWNKPAFNQPVAASSGLRLKLQGCIRSRGSGVNNGRSALYTIIGQRISSKKYRNGMTGLPVGIYVEKLPHNQ